MNDTPFELAQESDLPSPNEIEEVISKLDSLVQAKASAQAIIAVIEDVPFCNAQMLSKAVNSPSTVYRVTQPWENMDDTLVASFGMPPVDRVKRGRANIERHPVFYCALQEDTAIQEVLHKYPKEETGQLVYLSRWKPHKPFNIKQLFYPDSIIQGEVAKAFVETATTGWERISGMYSKAQSQALLALWRKMGSFFLDPDENYPVSAYLGHEALYNFNPPAGYQLDFLAYPSVARQHEGVNFAISPRFVNHLELEEVRKYRVGQRSQAGSDVTLLAVGKPADARVQWNSIRVPTDMYERVQARMQAIPDEDLHYESTSLNIGDTNVPVQELFTKAWQHFGPRLTEEVTKRMLGELVDDKETFLTLKAPLPYGPFTYEGRHIEKVSIHLTVKHSWGLAPIATAVHLT